MVIFSEWDCRKCKGADNAQHTTQQGHWVDGLLRGDELVDLAHRSLSLAKKAALGSTRRCNGAREFISGSEIAEGLAGA
ncbi:hypothetical protein ACWDSL_08260, partial [Streptomyces sp. NPDC000941]